MIVKTINNEPKYLSPTNAMLLVDVRKKVKSSFLCADTTILFQVSFVPDIGVSYLTLQFMKRKDLPEFP